MNQAVQGFKLFLEGVWKGKGQVIGSLNYVEELEVKRAKGNVFTIVQRTKNEEKGPLHSEMGYLRVFPKEGEKQAKIELCIAHAFGVCEISEGTLTENEAILKTSSVTRTGTAKEPYVTSFTRKYQLKEDGTLYYAMYLGTNQKPEEYFHLEGELKKETA